MDGNKRMGVLAAVVFLELNGYIVEEPPSRFYEIAPERRRDVGGAGGHGVKPAGGDTVSSRPGL